MPNPIEVLSLAEFERLLDVWIPVRQITQVHVHCTDHPRHAEFRGRASVEAMRSFHRSIGMADIAQHLTIDPQGLIWTGRPFDVMPASARGHNGTPKAGPFMIEMVGLFERNVDPFKGAQKDSAQAVVRAVLSKFNLDENAVKFHREFPNTGKTCPGMDLDPNKFRSEIQALLQTNTLRSFNVPVPRGVRRGTLGRNVLSGTDLRLEPDYLEVPEYADAAAELAVRTNLIEQGRLSEDEDAGARGADEEFRDLIGHAVNTSQGILSGKGAMRNTPADLDVLIRDHLSPQFDTGKFHHLLFYAHGGLVGEKSALRYARAMLPWWRSHGVYPIFFVWESSLFQTVFQRPRGGRGLTDVTDKGFELATQGLARPIWARMKANARRCSASTTDLGQPGGLHELAQRLIPWLRLHKNVKLHAVGHSTGPIVLSSFMPLLVKEGFPFASLNYLAPAIRIDDYARDVAPLVDGSTVERLRIFTMSDRAERDDSVAKVYRKSLLYYVRDACEDKSDGRLLGLQRDLFDDANMRAAFALASARDHRAPATSGITDVRAIEFAQREEDAPINARTIATAHSGFDNDEATMRSVLANVLRVADVGFAGDRFPAPEDFERDFDSEDAARAAEDASPDDEPESTVCTCHCCTGAQTDRVSAFDREDDDDYDDDEDAAGKGSTTTHADGPPVGRRLAVCIGIDSYPTMPLNGCVNDSRAWQTRLEKVGFTVTSLRNRNATRAHMLSALTSLVNESRSGDQLVFQYAGHGTQVPDLNGDEIDRFDEALVPIDYQQGELLTDDDIYQACARLRERPGVTLTFFMDCCNSGTNTRVAPLPKPGQNQNVRFLRMPASVLREYESVRKSQRAGAAPTASERDPVPGVVSFAACLDHEFAFETDGHGDFTTHATGVIDSILAKGASNHAFITAVVKAFGSARRQTPMMQNPAPGLKERKLLGGR
ncbi:MAG: caspase family protein [Gemmatimonadaceae bacterium]